MPFKFNPFTGSLDYYASASSGSFTPMPTTVVTTTSQTMSVNNAYVANNASLVTLTLPATAAVGDEIQVIGKGAGGWTIAQNAGQYIVRDSLTTATGTIGGLRSTIAKACVWLKCTVANTEFEVINSQGTTTIVGAAAGYMVGGYNGSTYSNVYEKINFATEAASTLAATLGTSRSEMSGMSSSTAGYTGAGWTGSVQTAIDKLLFSTEARSLLAATLTGKRAQGTGSQSSTTGYSAGGNTGTAISAIQNLDFSAETVSTNANSLQTVRRDHSSVSAPTKSYMMGGLNAGTPLSSIDVLTFSSGTTATMGQTLSVTRTQGGGMYSTTAGYYASGDDANVTYYTSTDKIDFATENRTTLAATLPGSVTRQNPAGVSSAAKGMLMGGYNQSIHTTSIIALTFSNDTYATLAATISTGKSYGCGIQG